MSESRQPSECYFISILFYQFLFVITYVISGGGGNDTLRLIVVVVAVVQTHTYSYIL